MPPFNATTPYGLYQNITTDTLIKTGTGNILGVIINSHASGTLKLWDSLTASGTVLCNTITFNTGEHFIPIYGAKFTTGLFADVGGTVDLTIVYN